ncbi:MAG: ribosomal protein S18-alanine N-acetyltransferase [bacterium]|jgi:ribosomal-protein-alanine N-acetyltransferase|nr:ribosomal protein S18-alanine N-acetyltransferase [bacterium]
MPVVIRPVDLADVPAILAIERASFSDPWTSGMFVSEIIPAPYRRGLAAVDGVTGVLVGYCFLWMIEGDEIHVTNIAVDSAIRQQGVGRKLIGYAIALGQEGGYPSITLEVRVSNHTARRFYETLGFIEAGRRKNYYDCPKEDALILRLALASPASSSGELGR